MRRAVRVLLAAVLAAPVLVAAASPCLACACAGLAAPQIIDQADEVFIGSMTGDRQLEQGTAQRFEVERVYKGVLPPEIELYAPVGPGFVQDCVLLFSPGTRVAVAVNRDDQGRPTTSVCAILQVDQPERFAGPGAQPIDGAPFPAIPTRPADPTSPTVPGWLWAAAGIVLAILLIAVWQRRDRRSDGAPPGSDDGSCGDGSAGAADPLDEGTG